MPTRPPSYITTDADTVITSPRQLGSLPGFSVVGVPTETTPVTDWAVPWETQSDIDDWQTQINNGMSRSWVLPDVEFDFFAGLYVMSLFGCTNFSRLPDLTNEGFWAPPQVLSHFRIQVLNDIGSTLYDFESQLSLLDFGDVGVFDVDELPVGDITGPSATTKEKGTYNHLVVDGYHSLPQFDVDGSMIITPRFSMFGYKDGTGNVFTGGDFQVYRSHCCVVLLGASDDNADSHGIEIFPESERATSWTGN